MSRAIFFLEKRIISYADWKMKVELRLFSWAIFTCLGYVVFSCTDSLLVIYYGHCSNFVFIFLNYFFLFENIQLLPSNLRQANISGNSSMDLQSLLDMEELHDKDLEEAQEYRHKCEIEERNALKAYRKAQKALIEANARCSALFSKREKYSAQLRVLMIENPDVLFSTGSQLATGGALNPSTTSGANMPLIPSSCCPAQLAFNGHDVDFHSGFDAPQNVSDRHVDRDKLASDPFSEPDVSTSELNKENHEAHGVCLQSDDASMSMEEEDAYRKSPQNSSEYQGEGTFGVAQEKEVNNGSGRQLFTDSSQDSLLLEASLRSQLFERLKMKTLPKKLDQSHSVEPMTESMLEVDVGQRMGMSSGNISSSEVEKEKEKASDFQGILPLDIFLLLWNFLRRLYAEAEIILYAS